jgi:hypothetical protein
MTRRRSMRREARRGGRTLLPRAAGPSIAACAAAVVALGMGGCANHNATDLARQACRHVERSLTLYQASLRATNPGVATAKQAQAVAELRVALPIAATAAGEAGQFQGLMSTLAESDHIPESRLIHSLGEQCAAADANSGFNPTTPTTAGTPATRPPPTGL